jgi:hypothetical protein
MELRAAIESMRWLIAHREFQAELVTDSEYLQLGIRDRIHDWARRGWKLRDGSPVKNLDLWKQIAGLLVNFEDLELTWVRGHQKYPEEQTENGFHIRGNLHADWLANIARNPLKVRTEAAWMWVELGKELVKANDMPECPRCGQHPRLLTDIPGFAATCLCCDPNELQPCVIAISMDELRAMWGDWIATGETSYNKIQAPFTFPKFEKGFSYE